MRSRSSQRNDPPPDWVDGSWTVDCICGVNFDDGEEMVDCDECGVWVHTRCSRYVKGEKSFACDKCKSKSSRNDSEETEVAQLLVELPMKTMSLEASYHFKESTAGGRAVKLWKDVPLEEKVHVQGIPGGDPSLFSGLSSVLTPELWKCTGYVPKKLNFQYKEFPCWDQKDQADLIERQENENADDKGADALFSLSKEAVFTAPLSTNFIGTRGRGEGGDYRRKSSSRESQRSKNEHSDIRREHGGIKNERSMIRPIIFHSGKRKKEDLGIAKDHSGKKRSRVLQKEADAKKRDVPSCRTVFSRTNDSKKLEFSEDRDSKFLRNDSQNIKKDVLMGIITQEPVSDGILEQNVEKRVDTLAAYKNTSKVISSDTCRRSSGDGTHSIEDKASHHALARVESSSKPDILMSSQMVDNDVGSPNVEEEVENDTKEIKPYSEGIVAASVEVNDNHIHDSTSGISKNPVKNSIKIELEADNGCSRRDIVIQSPHDDMKLEGANHLALDSGISSGLMSKNHSLSEAKGRCLQEGDPKIQCVDKSPKILVECPADTVDKLPSDHCQLMQLEDCKSQVMNKSPTETTNGLEKSCEEFGIGEALQTRMQTPQQEKIVGGVSKSSTLSTVISDGDKPELIQNPATVDELGAASDSMMNFKKDRIASSTVRDEDRHRKSVKEHKKPSIGSASASRLSKNSHVPVARQTLPDSKDPVVYTAFKGSVAQNLAIATVSDDSASPSQIENISHRQKKITPSGSSQRGDKFSQPNNLPSSKLNQAPQTHHHPHSSSAAGLSDEELALLLHQELNSSPRVPRVPRVRQNGSLPQITSPTSSASTLMKRSSSFGGKEQSSVSRRKSKDASKDGSHSARELGTSPEQRIVDSISKETEEHSTKTFHADKKNVPPYSTSSNGGPSTSAVTNGQNVSYMRRSPRTTSDEDRGIGGGPTHHTLPGLISEIMSKGQRMTYEELCNAVLPHWNNLRKHNGERYAYSSHSQAVLDCLRNRSEWAQLVDRGPKTNPSRKRRKFDSEAATIESEDDKDYRNRTAEEEDDKNDESREDFPKGKRKARKRRRLALRGRGIKDVRKRRKEEDLSDDVDPFSNSSEDSTFDEDEGDVSCPVGSETSASSDE